MVAQNLAPVSGNSGQTPEIAACQPKSGVLNFSDLLATYKVPGEQGHYLVCEFHVVPDQFFRNLQDLLQRHADDASRQQTSAPAEQCLKRPLHSLAC